jgi:type III restriction enzyme
VELKNFQRQVLEAIDAYIDALKRERVRYDKIVEANAHERDPDLVRPLPHYPKAAWDDLRRHNWLPRKRLNIPYSQRSDPNGEPVPNACLKIPTGGGKTLIAVSAISRIFANFMSTNRGLVLWIVPNDAIYRQTLERLSDREDPYRQSLDRLSAGRVLILQKGDRLARADVETHLCVLLLMLQSANRQSKETLRLFKDRGDVHGFIPYEDDYEGHRALIASTPNLDVYGSPTGFISIVKSSLGNALRLIRPVVIVDEGHKAYSSGAMRTVLGFNPSFLLELSATPKDRLTETPPVFSNWLVDVRGRDLLDEELIRLPINLEVKGGVDWREALRASAMKLEQLAEIATELRANSAAYIRPLLIVQVERTGRDQRDATLIHAEDAKQYLVTLGYAPHEIAIKSAQQDDLQPYGAGGLLEPTCPIRIVITKQALQEGWDCPFAYILCSLSASRSLSSMSQLVGRVIRQVGGRRTPVAALNESYVICHHERTRDVIGSVKRALEGEGMSDLADQVTTSEHERGTPAPRKLKRRMTLTSLDVTLPRLLYRSGNDARPIVFESDILSRIPWDRVDGTEFAKALPSNIKPPETRLTRITVSAARNGFSVDPLTSLAEVLQFDGAFVTRALSDVVPNPWICRRIIAGVEAGLEAKGLTKESLGGLQSFLIEELRKWLTLQRDVLAEELFRDMLSSGTLVFSSTGGWSAPTEADSEFADGTPQLMRETGEAIQKSLLVPTYRPYFNEDEAAFASYVDDADAVIWWHRNPARKGEYFLQGWRPNRVYPDFIFEFQRDNRSTVISVIETKGDQLAGNLDTQYKKRLLSLLAEHADAVGHVNPMEADRRIPMKLDVFLISEWRRRLHTLFRQKDDVAASD